MPNAVAGPDDIFSTIAHDLATQGYCILTDALPEPLAQQLHQQVQQLPDEAFQAAGIGREQQHTQLKAIRRDKTHWITGETHAEKAWHAWAAQLQQHLNRRLFLGLFSFESHFACYQPGDFYRRHLDAFRGSVNRVLTVTTYLNHNWQEGDGGELVIYAGDGDEVIACVQPEYRTLVIFLSEEYPHEVLATKRERYSIAGWFRINGSVEGAIDPPS